MHPKLIEIPFIHLPIYAYGVMAMLAFLTAIFIASRRADRDKLPAELFFNIGLIAMISGIIGARIFYLIYFSEQFDFSLFNIGDGGLSIIGAVIGFSLPFTIRYLRTRKTAQDAEQKQSSKQAYANIGLTFKSFFYLSILSLASAIVLSRIVFLALNLSQYKWDIFYVWQGGLVAYGGFVLATIAIITYLKINRLPILKTGDLLMPVLLLATSVWRVGCFLNGCCYGRVCHEPWAVSFPVIRNTAGEITGSPAFSDQLGQHLINKNFSSSLPVHPTELYESLLCALFFVILSIIWAKKKRLDDNGNPVEGTHGYVVAWGGIFYSTGRFIVEFFRGDNKSFVMGLSYSQLISIGMLIFCIGLLIWVKTRNKTVGVNFE